MAKTGKTIVIDGEKIPFRMTKENKEFLIRIRQNPLMKYFNESDVIRFICAFGEMLLKDQSSGVEISDTIKKIRKSFEDLISPESVNLLKVVVNEQNQQRLNKGKYAKELRNFVLNS